MKDLINRVKKAQDLLNIQCSKGNYDQSEYMRGMANGMKVLMSVFDDMEPEFIDAPDNLVPEAMGILRLAMKDKSEGGLYHGWMCNIKFAIYDSIRLDTNMIIKERLLEGCEEGAKVFLDRLLKKDKQDGTQPVVAQENL